MNTQSSSVPRTATWVATVLAVLRAGGDQVSARGANGDPRRIGCVRDLRNGNVINETGQLIQICVCAAAGDCEIDL